jgi:hypothetical protein
VRVGSDLVSPQSPDTRPRSEPAFPTHNYDRQWAAAISISFFNCAYAAPSRTQTKSTTKFSSSQATTIVSVVLITPSRTRPTTSQYDSNVKVALGMVMRVEDQRCYPFMCPLLSGMSRNRDCTASAYSAIKDTLTTVHLRQAR